METRFNIPILAILELFGLAQALDKEYFKNKLV